MQRPPATTPATTESGLSLDVRRLVASSIAPKYPQSLRGGSGSLGYLTGREAGD